MRQYSVLFLCAGERTNVGLLSSEARFPFPVTPPQNKHYVRVVFILFMRAIKFSTKSFTFPIILLYNINMDEYDEQNLYYDNLEQDDYDNDDVYSSEQNNDLDDAEIEMAGSLDGESDTFNGLPLHSGYGSSIGLNDLTDEQHNLYDSAYYAGHDSASDPDNSF